MSANSSNLREIESSLPLLDADTAVRREHVRAGVASADAVLNFPPQVANIDPVTGVVGRCFLRVCLLLDLMSGWLRPGDAWVNTQRELQSRATGPGPTA